ncbi:hypothetical protein AYO20_07377 [Fonsecaea nubica]|uniref:Uncharacterized protein n=1 Tax=Fonsecaea nubica TaxID=856822 RepID=A0A178CV80_9EURO|nr:hypothetical protein AYO20_07377 [Fonsecaea nubica]OAL33366.1 hypothetical protein AYO20_07377 [Fonsecaea nubica]
MVSQSEVNDYQRDIVRDKASNFRGKARVMLNVLRFTPENIRDLDRANVERLKAIYEEEGCLREGPERHVPAIISLADLTRAIEFTGTSEVSLDRLLDNPKELPPLLKFPPNVHIECLTGKHRIQAARESAKLRAVDKWWIVDLYLEGLSDKSKRALSEEYSNSLNFSDGIIFLKIIYYESAGDKFAEFQCWARLTKSKRDILRRFLARRDISAAFKRLLPFYGLWTSSKYGFNIGTLHKMIGMNMEPEIIHYTELIFDTWKKIFRENRELYYLTDPDTVAELQSRAPGASPHDLNKVTQLMSEGQIFREIRDTRHRGDILRQLSSIPYPIPTFYTLRQDLIYIKPCAAILRRLFVNSKRRSKYSIREAAEHAFSGVNQTDGQVVLQTSESSFQSVPGSLTHQITVGYRQIVAYAMRFVLDMVPQAAKKEAREATPQPRKPNPALWRGIGTLAYRLGFESEEIHRLRTKDADRAIARDMLLMARDPKRYKYPDGLLENFEDQIAEMMKTATEMSEDNPVSISSVDGSGEKISHRRGWIVSSAYESSQPFLFFKHLNNIDDDLGKGVTSFLVRKSVYIAFFGIVKLPSEEPPSAEQDSQPPNQDPGENGGEPHDQDVNMQDQSGVDTTHQESREQDVNMEGQDTNVDVPPGTDAQSLTTSLKRGRWSDPRPPSQFRFVFESPQMYPIDTGQAKKIILGQNPNASAQSKSVVRKKRQNSPAAPGHGGSPRPTQQTSGPSVFGSLPPACRSRLMLESPSPQQESQPIHEQTVSISIWENGKWNLMESDCKRDEVGEKVTRHLWRNDGLHPYDEDGRGLSEDQFFDVVVNQRSRMIYLARPQDESTAFEL